jgi:hypothetical protein
LTPHGISVLEADLPDRRILRQNNAADHLAVSRTILTSRQGGSVMLEFCLVSVPIVFVVVSLIWMCMGMWQYQTMEEAVNFAVRLYATHGADCVGQTCATTVGNAASVIQQRMIGIPDSQVNVTLTSTASTVTCNPLHSCYSNSSYWPSLAGNTAGTDLTIKAQLTLTLPIGLWTPHKGTQQFSGTTVAAQARQMVVY